MARKHNAKGRTSYSGVVPPGTRFYIMRHDIVKSDAWRSLGGAACKVYAELRCRLDSRPAFNNNGRISLGIDEAARLLGLGNATVHRAFGELIDKGLLRRTMHGSFHARLASTYAFTDLADASGSKPTNEWRGWKRKSSLLAGIEFPSEAE